MSRSHYKLYDTHYPYFLTLTINNGVSIFTRPRTASILLEALRYQQQHYDLNLYAYVILKCHIHLIVRSEQLTKMIASLKRWTAQKIIEVLNVDHAQRVLNALLLPQTVCKQGRQYQVWAEDSAPQKIHNLAMMQQKVEYIHNNPVNWGYVVCQEHWRYSSARNYSGREGLLRVDQSW
jgi:REP element-mobilizing transposase RayT